MSDCKESPEPIPTSEWRKMVMEELGELKAGQKELVTSVNELSLNLAGRPNGGAMKEIETRVRVLENDKFKVTGIIIAVNFAFGIGLALIEVFKHGSKP
jgi:hypothetical protein